MNVFQALEQMQALLRDVAPILYSYQEELIKQGFTRDEAFELVKECHRIMLTNEG